MLFGQGHESVRNFCCCCCCLVVVFLALRLLTGVLIISCSSLVILLFLFRSAHIVSMIARYQKKCIKFVDEVERKKNIMLEGEKMVGRRRAQVVACSLGDVAEGEKERRKKKINIIKEELNEEMNKLQRYERERESLDRVLMEQQKLIHQLTYSNNKQVL